MGEDCNSVAGSLGGTNDEGGDIDMDVCEEFGCCDESDFEARAFPGAGSSAQVSVSGIRGRQAEFERRLGAAGGRIAEQAEGGEVAGVDEESDYSSESSDSSWFARQDVEDQAHQ